MFLGQFQQTLNRDRSFVLPEGFRTYLADGLYITRGFEQNLLLMSEQVFQAIYQRVSAMNIADPLARLLLRLILSNAARLEMDDAGKLLIPEQLAASVQLEENLVLVGQGAYIELWSPAEWEQQSALLLDVDANTERFAQLDLALN